MLNRPHHTLPLILTVLFAAESLARAETPDVGEVRQLQKMVRTTRATLCQAGARLNQDSLTRCRELGALEFLIHAVDQELATQKKERDAIIREPGQEAYAVARELEESIDRLIEYRKRLAARHATQHTRHIELLAADSRVPRESAISHRAHGLARVADGFLERDAAADGRSKGTGDSKGNVEHVESSRSAAAEPVITERDCLPILNRTIIRWRCGR